MSLGSTTESTYIKNLIDKAIKKKIFIIAAAGNNLNGKVDFPANHPKVISVGSINPDLKKVPFTAYGKIDFVAPGYNILSTSNNHQYSYFSHTSASAAFVTAIFAKNLSSYSSRDEYNWNQVYTYFKNIAVQFEKNKKHLFGHGLIQE